MRRKTDPIISNNGWFDGECDVCGAKGPVAVCSSLFGATSYAYCQDCFEMSKEPYSAVVAYISSAGHWPEDINERYQQEVRRQLRLHGKPEEIFKFDVERAIAEERAFIEEYCINKTKEVLPNDVENLFS